MALTARVALLGLCAAAGFGACTRAEAPRTLGRAVVSGAVVAMRPSPDGAYLAYLHACRPVQDRTLPPGVATCSLAVVSSSGGSPVRVAQGVTSFGPGFGWAPRGHYLAALADYVHADARGTLVTWDGGDPRTVAPDVTFHGFDRDGARLAWIAHGQLFVSGERGAAQRIEGADRLSTFEFGSGPGVTLLARRTAAAGGTLLAVQGTFARPLASEVQEYEFAAGAPLYAFTAGPARTLAIGSAAAGDPRIRGNVARAVHAFVWAPRSGRLAFVADAKPGRQGDLWIADGIGGAPALLGRRVGEPRWGSGGTRLGWLQEYDPRSRTGTLAVRAEGAPPRVLTRNVSDFDLSVDGRAVAALVHDTAAGYSVNLVLAVGDAPPVTVARGVFGFGFSPDARWLYYRTACTREAEACDLLRIPATGLPAGKSPERIAEGAKSFEFAPGSPERLLVTWSRKDRVALDVAIWQEGKLGAVDTSALPGSIRFLGASRSRLAWIGNDPKRPGVYVADVP